MPEPFVDRMVTVQNVTSNKQKTAAVMRNTVATLSAMLEFVTTVRIQKYIIDQRATGFREFEAEVAELRENWRITGTGVIATRESIVAKPTNDERDFLRDDVPLGSYELGAYIDAFPLSAAAASYLFTLLEVYGNDVAELVNSGSINRNKAWHEDIKGNADLRDNNQIIGGQKGFSKHFKIPHENVPAIAVERMVGLKKSRNDFAHDGGQLVDFIEFARNTIAVVCHIAFLTTSRKRISVYPWEDHLELFVPKTKV